MPGMKKVIKIFNSFVEADKDEKGYYRSLSPAQRLDILLSLIAQHQVTQDYEATEGFKRVYRIIKRS